MSTDLTGQISKLSDEDAIAALAFVLDLEDVTTQDIEQLSAAQDRLPQAFAETPGMREFAVPERAATTADLVRATLIYLAEEESTGPLVGEAVSRPRREAQRDPLTLAVGGLIMLALKSEVQLKHDSGKWSFSYRLKPTKDSALAGILAKLWGLYGGGQQ